MRRTLATFPLLFALLCFCTTEIQAALAPDGTNPIKQGLPMQPPRALLQKMFPQDPLYLSLSGGWGYEQADPIVLSTPQELKKQYFDTEPLEFAMVDLRNYEEFAGAQSEAHKMIAMGFEVEDQQLIRENGKVYERIRGRARVISVPDFTKLSKDVEQVDPQDTAARKALESRVTRVPRTYWFDLTEPFAHNTEMEKSGIKPPKDLRR